MTDDSLSLSLREAVERAEKECSIMLGVLRKHSKQVRVPDEQLVRRVVVLEDAIRTFLAKYDEVDPYITSAFFIAFTNRGGQYAGPDFAAELKALRDLVGE